jgi:hypothetical protein
MKNSQSTGSFEIGVTLSASVMVTMVKGGLENNLPIFNFNWRGLAQLFPNIMNG